jgi:ATP-dependent DNA helicase RecQ
MKDQRDALTARGIAAASLDSSLTLEESSAVRQQLREKKLKILYVAPERSVHRCAHSCRTSLTV